MAFSSAGRRPTTPGATLPRIWIDCDDLMSHFDGWSTPTGICRVQLEIIPQLIELAPGRIVLCRIGRSARELQILSPRDLDRVAERSESPQRAAASDALMRSMRFAALKSLGFVRRMAMRAGLVQPETRPAKGDVILAMGGTWSNPGFAGAVRGLKAQHGLRLAHLVHDLLPMTHSALVADRQVARFGRWIGDVTELSDCLLTPSNYTADVLREHLARAGRGDVPVTPVIFGSGFSGSESGGSGGRVHARPYVLFVSTIEVRKNHLFLARVWQRLVEKHGAQAVPDLLLVGRFGWKTQGFVQFLKETNHLDGKIVIRSNLSDSELHQAYDGCLFTVFPSLAEGWGLPVDESLAHGKACVASRATSIPEVGGKAADYFDPADENAAIVALEAMLFEPGYRQAREDWIRTNYRPRDWADAAGRIMAALDGAFEGAFELEPRDADR
ncbi:MAG: glycosyltransferase family 1 protein [Mesorhizobium sp.]